MKTMICRNELFAYIWSYVKADKNPALNQNLKIIL